MEPDPRRGARPDPRTRPRRARAVAARAGSAVYRRAGLLRLRSVRLPPAESAGVDHQPGIHRDEGGRRVRTQDHGAEPALADRLHLPQGHRLGLVLSQHDPRRLLALHHRLEAVYDHEGP